MTSFGQFSELKRLKKTVIHRQVGNKKKLRQWRDITPSLWLLCTPMCHNTWYMNCNLAHRKISIAFHAGNHVLSREIAYTRPPTTTITTALTAVAVTQYYKYTQTWCTRSVSTRIFSRVSTSCPRFYRQICCLNSDFGGEVNHVPTNLPTSSTVVLFRLYLYEKLRTKYECSLDYTKT